MNRGEGIGHQRIENGQVWVTKFRGLLQKCSWYTIEHLLIDLFGFAGVLSQFKPLYPNLVGQRYPKYHLIIKLHLSQFTQTSISFKWYIPFIPDHIGVLRLSHVEVPCSRGCMLHSINFKLNIIISARLLEKVIWNQSSSDQLALSVVTSFASDKFSSQFFTLKKNPESCSIPSQASYFIKRTT